ncbi:hypothetical protein MMT26_31600, partial [Escherichia coli]|nr:hypothetical protein [Escherichia coli]
YVGRRGCAYFVRSGARCQVSFQIYRVKRLLRRLGAPSLRLKASFFVHDGVVNLELIYFLV